MIFNDGVRIAGLKPEIAAILPIVDRCYEEIAGHEATCTSAVDGTHSIGSLHYVGFAVDFRIWGLDEDELNKIVRLLRNRLTAEFDVVLEDTHIHIEFQPKRALNS